MREAWESQASSWECFARTPGHDHSHEHINLPTLLELLPAAGRRTLDLGCGEGRLGRRLRGLGHRVVAIDSSPTMIHLVATHEIRLPALVGDATRLPFRDEEFDLVVAYMSLQASTRCPPPWPRSLACWSRAVACASPSSTRSTPPGSSRASSLMPRS